MKISHIEMTKSNIVNGSSNRTNILTIPTNVSQNHHSTTGTTSCSRSIGYGIVKESRSNQKFTNNRKDRKDRMDQNTRPNIHLDHETWLKESSPSLTILVDRLGEIDELKEPVRRALNREGSYGLVVATYAYDQRIGRYLFAFLVDKYAKYWGYSEKNRDVIIADLIKYIIIDGNVNEDRYTTFREAFSNEIGGYSKQRDLFQTANITLRGNTKEVIEEILEIQDPEVNKVYQRCLVSFREILDGVIPQLPGSSDVFWDRGELIAITPRLILLILLNRINRTNLGLHSNEVLCYSRLYTDQILYQLDLNTIDITSVNRESLTRSISQAILEFDGQAPGLQLLTFETPSRCLVTTIIIMSLEVDPITNVLENLIRNLIKSIGC